MSFEPNDLVRVDAIASNNNQDIVNVYHFLHTGQSSITDEQGLDDLLELIEALLTIMEAVWTAVTVWQRIRVQNESQQVVYGTVDFDSPIPGTATSDAGARQVAAVVNFPTLASRRIGRKFYGPVPELYLSASTGTLTGDIVTDLNAAIAFLLVEQNMTNSSWRFVVRTSDLVASRLPIAGELNIVPAALGRRRLGVGS